MKTGVLLINLGTPAAPTAEAVRVYLREFLMDRYVITLPVVLRWLLVHGIILRSRPKASAAAYQQIWTPQGSPLLLHGLALKTALSEKLGRDYSVELGMRYGNPSIADAVIALHKAKCTRIIALPLFPQYSTAATGSAIVALKKAHRKYAHTLPLIIQRDFYSHPDFIAAYAALIRQYWQANTCDHLLMSYHGLPVKHLTQIGCKDAKHCAQGAPCPIQQHAHPDCYRAQAYTTSRLLADALQLDDTQYSVSFQSRLGRTPWIKPYTDFQLPELRKRGIETLAVVCPSFVADCLETLEEIGLRANAQWQALGGKQLLLIPCLNANAAWTAALANMVSAQGNLK